MTSRDALIPSISGYQHATVLFVKLKVNMETDLEQFAVIDRLFCLFDEEALKQGFKKVDSYVSDYITVSFEP